MKKNLRTFLRFALSYLFSGAVLLMYIRWPHFEGHAHIPFSEFPYFLIASPVAPLFLLGATFDEWLVFFASLLIFYFVAFRFLVKEKLS